MKRHRLFTLFLAGIFSLKATFALDSARFPDQTMRLLTEAFSFLKVLYENPITRAGLSIILLIIIFYQIYNSAIKMVKVFAQSSEMIATPLSLLSVLAIYWKLKSLDTISKLLLWLVLAVIIIYIIKGFMWIGRTFKGGYNPRRAIRDEKQVRSEANKGIGLENELINNENAFQNEIKKEEYDTETIKKQLKETENKAKSAQKTIRKLFDDTRNG